MRRKKSSTGTGSPLVLLVSGDRHWTSEDPIRRELSKFPRGTIVVHGAQRGVDTIAGRVAEELGFVVRPYPARWWESGKAAGPIRNAEMLEKEKPDLVLAFHPDIDRKSRGTKDMVAQAEKAGVPVKIFCD